MRALGGNFLLFMSVVNDFSTDLTNWRVKNWHLMIMISSYIWWLTATTFSVRAESRPNCVNNSFFMKHIFPFRRQMSPVMIFKVNFTNSHKTMVIVLHIMMVGIKHKLLICYIFIKHHSVAEFNWTSIYFWINKICNWFVYKISAKITGEVLTMQQNE